MPCEQAGVTASVWRPYRKRASVHVRSAAMGKGELEVMVKCERAARRQSGARRRVGGCYQTSRSKRVNIRERRNVICNLYRVMHQQPHVQRGQSWASLCHSADGAMSISRQGLLPLCICGYRRGSIAWRGSLVSEAQGRRICHPCRGEGSQHTLGPREVLSHTELH
jgi:hypothetical protein